MVKIRVREIQLSSGQTLPIEDEGIYVIVGPNNSGKSTLLTEIYRKIEQGISTTSSFKVCKDIKLEKNGAEKDLKDFLEKHIGISTSTGYRIVKGFQVSDHEANILSYWQNINNGLHSATKLFVTQVNTNQRLTAVTPPKSIDFLRQHAEHPIQALYQNDQSEKKLSAAVNKAFGSEITVNRGGGATIPLHFGKPPIIELGEDRVSFSYLSKLRELPLVSEQGDGIKSYVGTLLLSTIFPRQITLIDEPEAFLHPPQSRLMGKYLGKEFSGGQLFISTHSGDFLRGLLDSNSKNVHVIRITRKDDTNTLSVLNPKDITDLWGDTILRFSNILDGIFHESVIVCESDSDCRFFSSVLDSLQNTKENVASPDVMFTSSGGKHRFFTIVRSLKKLGVNTRIIADFDILSEESAIKELVELAGGDWTAYSAAYRKAVLDLKQLSPPLSAAQVAQSLQNIISEFQSSSEFRKDHKERIGKAMKATNPWTKPKELGIMAFPPGNAVKDIVSIISYLKSIGIYVIPIGELESFDRSVSGHGPSWVNMVLTKTLDEDTFPDAFKFIMEMFPQFE